MADLTPIILLPNLPKASFCGIDLISFTTSERFRGVKNVPPGWHFLFVSPSSSILERHGVWVYAGGAGSSQALSARSSGTPLIILNWSATDEELVPEHDATKVLWWRANLGSVWREGLTPYRQSVAAAKDEGAEEDELMEEKNHWSSLTDYISTDRLARFTGTTKYAAHNIFTLSSASCSTAEDEEIPGLDDRNIGEEASLSFLSIDLKRTWREGAVGRERTDGAKDRSWALENLPGSLDDVLAETQFTFLMALTLANFSCLLQWRKVVELVLTCKKAVEEQLGFFARFLRLLGIQLEHCDDVEGGGLFEIREEGGRMLKELLRRFRKVVEEVAEGKGEVKEGFEELEGVVKKTFGWELSDDFVKRGKLQLEDGEEVEMVMNGQDEEDEMGEYAPVVVDLGDAQIRTES